MANARLSKEKQAMVLAAICEGVPMNAVTRMFSVGKHAVSRVVEEAGNALADYMEKEFRDLPCERLALDEAWQYVGKHGQRMAKREEGRGDFWLWAGIDSDTKLIVAYRIGNRAMDTCNDFVADLAKRVTGPVQITTDAWSAYEGCIIENFDTPQHKGYSYAIEKKIFSNPFTPEEFPKKRQAGVNKIVKADREQAIGYPDLRTTTTTHIERFFLTVRQELKRFQRLGLGYSKILRMHKAATALAIGVYNLVRKHTSLDGQTPAQAAGIEEKRWTMIDVVELTARYVRAKEDAKFEAAFANL